MTETERIEEILRLDCENQHIKHYQEGYREGILTQIHGEYKLWNKLQIDVDRYSPDSARRISYDQGWNDAVRDYGL